MSPRQKLPFAAFLAVISMMAFVGSASAEALTPWWGMSTSELPTNLSGMPGSTERQRLTIDATGGEFLIGREDKQTFKEIEEFKLGKRSRESLRMALLPFNASLAEVQAAVQRVYPDREAAVSSASGGGFQITFPNQSVEPFISTGLVGFLGGTPLSGGKEEARVEVLEPGAASQKEIVLSAENRGDAATSGTISLADQLPAGLHPVAISGHSGGPAGTERGAVECMLSTLTCTAAGSLHPYEVIEVHIAVVPTGALGEGAANTASVFGGGAPTGASVSQSLKTGGSVPFGIEHFELVPERVGGAIDTQAGSHPFQLTNTFTLNTDTPDSAGNPQGAGMVKDLGAALPPGMVGNPTPFAQCTDAQFADGVEVSNQPINECPPEAALGVATVSFNNPSTKGGNGYATVTAPIFNMTPRTGEPVRFGFLAGGFVAAFLDTKVRTGGDYGVTVTSSNIGQATSVVGVKLSFWGVPGDPRHDSQRGWLCLESIGSCPTSQGTTPPPFLVLPTSCAAPFEASAIADSWGTPTQPGEVAAPVTFRLPEELDGCNHLPFEPSIITTPDGTAASTPTGLNVDVHLPQDAVLHADGLAESSLKDISVALPQGVAVNPATGDGLQACSEAQIGYLAAESSPPQRLAFTPTLQPGLSFCADASKIGTVKITLPILPHPLTGAVYIANQNQNPFGSLIALYIVAEDPVSGVLVKLPAEVHITATGQLLTTIENSPQAPLEDAELHFFGGQRAPLATPAHCGTYTTDGTFTPWSGGAPVAARGDFAITEGPNKTPCPGASLPFAPSLTGGTTNINAGSFSPLTTTIGRADGQQAMQSVQLHMPPGLSGILSGVKLCPEQQANEGTCTQESLIGETTVSAGVGSDPVSVKGGKVYLTEKYAGSPFGLSIVNPVKAGPFDLEHDTANPNNQPTCDCVVVRAKIDVDPSTAALTITTDASGPHAIPHLIDGIPVQIKNVNVLINRPGFTFNPTNCAPMKITGAITSDEGASSAVSVPLQVANCSVLKFAPKLTISTSGRTSKANGASLTAKLSVPNAAQGTQANVARVKVDLPRQLPSRLTTLQKACTAAQFAANPAGCPPDSIIGHATVRTPLLPVPLTGPAYFVSHGNEAFPSLTMVLQGYGVTVELVGTTFISKAGITSSTFKTVPDVPFNNFELTLPQGKFSALTANVPSTGNRSLCGQKLAMPTEFVAQNGALIRRNTPIAVSGCSKRKLSRAQKLAAALKACKKKPKGKRSACQRQAYRSFGAAKKKHRK